MYKKLATLSPIINKSSSYNNVLKRPLVFQQIKSWIYVLLMIAR